ncbi:MAG: hypothetical protein HQL52_15790 [Magnetococcales bacterium]|nr:hypothetical protein [Magnetococcales bacterium]
MAEMGLKEAVKFFSCTCIYLFYKEKIYPLIFDAKGIKSCRDKDFLPSMTIYPQVYPQVLWIAGKTLSWGAVTRCQGGFGKDRFGE